MSHGTRACYQKGCRQAECVEAARIYRREHYARSRGVVGRTVVPNNHLARFFNHTRPDGDCLIWTADTTNGYGKFSVEDRTKRAHRWLYETLLGPIPEGLTLDHLCRRRDCVRLAHLEPVPHAENVRRAVEARAQENAA